MPEDGQSDERIDSPYPRKRDMDARFLAGCTTIAIISLATYATIAWPFFAFQAHSREGLVQIGLAGAAPVLIVGTFLIRKLGLEAAVALVGGSIAGGIFAFLQLRGIALGHIASTQDLPEPDYPAAWVWGLPLAWVLVVAALALFTLPRRETQDQAEPPASR